MPKQKPKIIGTGLSGLVGSRITELLRGKYAFENLDLMTGVDITDELNLKKAIRKAKGDVLLHLAAYTNVDAAYEERGDRLAPCYRINVIGTRNIARLAAASETYLIHISTDFVFDGKKQTPYTEADKPHPIEWYGQTKYWAEEEVKKAGGKSAIVRIAYPFRAHFPPKLDLVRTVIRKLEQGSLYPMFNDQLITPTWIDDIAKAVEIVIRKRPQGIFHIVGSSAVSPFGLARQIAKTFNFEEQLVRKGSLEEYLKTSKRPYQKRLVLSNQKAKRELGITMSTLEVALRKLRRQMGKNCD